MTKPVINISKNGYPVKIITPKVDETANWGEKLGILARAMADAVGFKKVEQEYNASKTKESE